MVAGGGRMALLAYTIKQYPAKEQAELGVVVKMPGSWFGGQLTEAERAELYECQAYESFEAHESFRRRELGLGRSAPPSSSCASRMSLTTPRRRALSCRWQIEKGMLDSLLLLLNTLVSRNFIKTQCEYICESVAFLKCMLVH